MKKIILFLGVTILLLCVTNCSSEETKKGRFAKEVPTCIQQKVNEQIVRIDEYCSTDDTKRIYVVFDHFTLPYISTGYDENCRLFFIKQEGSPWVALNPEGFVLPDETIEYQEDIYCFKRTVFTQKN